MLLPTATKLDTITVRNLKESPLKKTVGIFVQILSLPAHSGNLCGDFSSLHPLIDFCKKAGLTHIHLGIDRINDNRLIDPILCNIKYQALPGVSLDEIRDIKIDLLKKDFDEWQKYKTRDGRFGEFIRMHGRFLQPFCQDQFALYVQYRLYSDLEQVSVHAINEGISLIIDIIVDDCDGSLDQQIQLFTPFAQYLKIVNASAVLCTVSVGDVYQIFGDLSQYCFNICNVYGNAVILRREFVPEETNIAAIDASKVPEDKTDDFCHSLSLLRALFESEERAKRKESFIQFFKSLAGVAPSAIMLDSAASGLVSEDDLADSGIICCSKRLFSEPNYLSPEVSSEFSISTVYKDSFNSMKKRLNGSAYGATYYLSDLLMNLCFGHINCIPLQKIQNHTRFVFQKSAEELLKSPEIIEKIRDFLQENNSLAI